MGGYSGSREQSYEIKYLRKALLRVDSRIRVPESIGAESLRHLLDEVERPAPRGAAKRARPRWLSLQSGIAYAAAFVLIVALFYSTRLYRPDIIDGVLGVDELKSSGVPVPAASASGEAAQEQPHKIDTFAAAEDAAQDSEERAADIQTPTAPAVAESADETPHAVGGSGMATLLLESGQISYYWRLNDETDPDRDGFPCTLELVDNATGHLITQIDLADMHSVEYGFELDNRFVIVGDGGGDTLYVVYDTANPENPVEQFRHVQCGELADAKLYKDILRIVTLSGEPDGDIVNLPHAASQEYCVIGAVSPVDYRSYTKSFAGADGSVQLHNLNAYIRYSGTDEDGGEKDYIAQINFDGLEVELGTVS